jgi:hypothetical protein
MVEPRQWVPPQREKSHEKLKNVAVYPGATVRECVQESGADRRRW